MDFDDEYDASLEESEGKLRALLENIYDSSQLLSFERLIEQYFECIPPDFSMLFYVCEERWFDEPVGKSTIDEFGDDFLKFQYLSFNIKNGRIRRHRTRNELLEQEAHFSSMGFKKMKNNLCVMYHQNDERGTLSPFLNLTKRIFVSYYKNCGSQEHFRKSIAERFTREFYGESPKTEDSDIVTYLYERLGLETSIVRQRDQMYFRDKAPLDELLVANDLEDLDPELRRSSCFRRDFIVSVKRKNQTFGQTENGRCNYAVNNVTGDYVIESSDNSGAIYKNRQKYCCIFYRYDDAITIDEIYLAKTLINTVKTRNDDAAQEQLTTSVYEKIGSLEAEISENPIAKLPELQALFVDSVKDILGLVIGSTAASSAVYYENHIFEQSLQPIIFCGNIDEQTVNYVKEHHRLDSSEMHVTPYHKAFETGEVVDLWHPKKLAREGNYRRKNEDRKAREANIRRYLESKAADHAIKMGHRASIIVQVKCGNVPCGVVEYLARSESRLSLELQSFKLIASLIGDLRRRLYLANDRGWLTRMSYLHTSRHRLENLRRKIQKMDPELEQELRRTIIDAPRSSARLGIPNNKQSEKYTPSQARSELAEETSVEFSDQIWGRLAKEGIFDLLSRGGVERLISILDTMFSNESHSTLDISRINFRVGSKNGDYLDITYRTDVRDRQDRMEQICLSPLPDHLTETYHYGLFLCSAQIRMQGGVAECPIVEPSPTGNSKFGLNFRIPL